MTPWEITIRKVQNGFRLSWYEDIDEGQVKEQELVVEEPDTEFGEIEAMQSLLYAVKEYFGHYGSKHDKKRLFINIEDQDND